MLLLFIGSGCAALIYEVVWLQLLQLNLGSSAVSVGVLLAVYMGGMCLGSLLLPRWISPKNHPLKVYALLESGIGVFGIIVLFAVPLIGKVYTMIAGSGPINLVLRTVVAAICLLPPTLLMGATLPAIGRFVQATPAGTSWLGYFYAGNLVGAVGGSLLAGYCLLRVYDMPTASFVAVGINVLVAALAWLVAKGASYKPAPVTSSTAEPQAQANSRLVYIGIALSGFTALGAEVVWTRLLSLHLGATTYTFSLILAVFLTGLGIGSSIGSTIARCARIAQAALGWCQLLLCAGMAWAAYVACSEAWLPDRAANWTLLQTFQHDIVIALWLVLPSAILWGASFPLALAAVLKPGQDSGRLVGSVYAANTLGCIFGASITSLVLMGHCGSQMTQQVLMAVSAFSGLLMLGPAVLNSTRPALRTAGLVALASAVFAAGILTMKVPPLPGILVAYGRNAKSWLGQGKEIVCVGEGTMACVAVTRDQNGIYSYHNAGKVQASSEPADMRLQRMLGHITTLVPKSPDKVLVIGCGAGVTAGAVSVDPMVKHQTICEIEPLVPFFVSTHFSNFNFSVVTNPKVHIHLDDARHYLLTSNEKFDAITSDPLDPWVKGAATLYTLEFFQVVKDHLKDDGCMTLFVQLYESDEEAVKSEVATFLKAFPDGAVFANTINGEGYDLVLYGPKNPHKINVDEIQARLNKPENAPIVKSLAEIGINSAIELFGNYAGRPADMAGWLGTAQINHDSNLRLQFLAGKSLNVYDNPLIYKHMIETSAWPEGYFEGKPETMAALRSHIENSLTDSRP
jgi:spermidine synthase